MTNQPTFIDDILFNILKFIPLVHILTSICRVCKSWNIVYLSYSAWFLRTNKYNSINECILYTCFDTLFDKHNMNREFHTRTFSFEDPIEYTINEQHEITAFRKKLIRNIIDSQYHVILHFESHSGISDVIEIMKCILHDVGMGCQHFMSGHNTPSGCNAYLSTANEKNDVFIIENTRYDEHYIDKLLNGLIIFVRDNMCNYNTPLIKHEMELIGDTFTLIYSHQKTTRAKPLVTQYKYTTIEHPDDIDQILNNK
jgi:hypothetical protein